MNSLSYKTRMGLVMFSVFLNSSFAFIFPLFGSILISVKFMTPMIAVLLLAFCNAVSGLFQLWVGQYLDRYGILNISLIGALANGVGVIIFLFDFSHPIFLIFGASLFFIGTATIQTLTVYSVEGMAGPSRRSKAAVLNYMMVNLGVAISSMIAYFWFLSHRSLLLWLDLLSALIAYFIIGRVNLVHFERSEKQKKMTGSVNFSDSILSIILNRFWVLFGVFCIYLALASPFSAIGVLSHYSGLDPVKMTSLSIGISSVVVVAFFRIASWMNNYYGDKAFFCSLMFIGIGFGMLPYATSFSIFLVSTLLWAIGELMVIAPISQKVFHIFGEDKIGVASGVRVFLLRSAFVVAPILSGFFRPETARWLFVLCFAILPVLGGGLILVRKVVRPEKF